MHRNFPCFSILGLTSIRALVSVIRDMTAMPAASPRQNQIGRIDTGALRTTAPAMLRYDQFLVGCRMAARSSLSMP